MLLGRIAMALIASGEPAAIGLGVALMVLPLDRHLGRWSARCAPASRISGSPGIAKDDGMELDVTALPRMPSGRIERDAADALFETVARNWKTIRTTGGAGIGWPARTTTPATAAARGKR